MRRRLGWFGLSLLLALLLESGSAAAQRASDSDELGPHAVERRIALVIGNGAYGPGIGPLANPANDARDIAAALESVGFEVALQLDVDRDRMRRAVIDFGLALRDGGVGLFYYSGHAVQLDGVNYMIPLGADVVSEAYMPVETLPVEEVLARMGGADNRLNIVILDSCRNNPFKGIFRGTTRGLAQTPAPSGTYIAYAAAPDALALDGAGQRNSPYTAALLTALVEPGLTLEDVFKRVRARVRESTNRFQTPWTGSSITGDFYFRLPEPAIEPAPTAPAAAPAASAPMVDIVVWEAIEDSRDPADFETFLEAYPDSPLAPFARNRLATLRSAGIAAVPSEAAPPAGDAPSASQRNPVLRKADPETAVSGHDMSSAALSAESRVALVIGNATYEYAPAIANPRDNAAGVAAALRRLGFKVKEAIDVDLVGMRNALREFAGLLEGAEVGLFYYSGHALQLHGRSYLVPVDGRLEREADPTFQALDLGVAFQQLEQHERTSLVFLDACGDNPFTRTLAKDMGTRSQAVGQGVAPVASGIGTLIAVGCQPNYIAGDGRSRYTPFTEELLARIETRGLEINRMLAQVRRAVIDQTRGGQVPWYRSSLTGEFYLSPQPPTAALAPRRPRRQSRSSKACHGRLSRPGPRLIRRRRRGPRSA